MGTCMSIEDFFTKPTVKDVCLFRDVDKSICHCSERQQTEWCNLSNEDLVFSNDSFRSILEEDGHDPFRFYEAELHTYPTKFMTKKIAVLFANEFEVDICWFSLKLHEPAKNEVFVKDYTDDILMYDRKLNKYFAFESFNAKGRSQCYVKADAKYIEDDVAGKVIYVIMFPDMLSLHKDSLSSAFLKKLIECGEQCGYDYIANGKTVFKDSLEFTVSFESKRQESEIEIEDKLYHVAPMQAKDKILKFGLNPHGEDYNGILQRRITKRKNGNNVRMHPYRVYLFNGLNLWAIKSFLSQLKLERKYNDKHLQKLKDANEFALFEIDRKKISHLKLYRDNNFESANPCKPIALYTYTNIPPSAIAFKQSLDNE